MLFNSLAFLVFFPATLLVRWGLRERRLRNIALLVASYYFYAQWDWRFLGLILVSTLVDFECARVIGRSRGAPRAKAALWVSLVTNLGLLGFFKYFDFFLGELHLLLAGLGADIPSELLGIAVPVGISFYTFQTMSYTIDVYRGDMEASSDLVEFALYVAFFPQLVAGPIERASSLLPQIRSPNALSLERMITGGHLIAWGLFKKVVIADNLGTHVVDPLFDPSMHTSGVVVLLAVYAFAIQIYCDFSGYSDIAIGCARCMGYDFRANFNLPYLATDPSDFWRRWHISLSTWLRDYLYVPLGGSRTGRTMRNLMITMLLGGLWHGANWTFLAWGAYHGALLVAFHHFRRFGWDRLSWGTRVFTMFHLTCIGWLLFRAPTFGQVLEMTTALLGSFFVVEDPDFFYTRQVLFFSLPLMAVHLAKYWSWGQALAGRVHWSVRSIVYTIAVVAFVILGRFGGQEFIYFQF